MTPPRIPGKAGLPTLPLVFLLSLLNSACELTEVTVPSGEPVVIVQAVLSRTRPIQLVLIEQSLTGGSRGGTGPSIPPSEPRIPITGARVLMTHRGPSPCAVPTVQLGARADTSGLYTTESLCPLSPGDVVDLRVETPDGVTVTGSTTVPGASTVSVTAGADTAAFEFQELILHRERDTLRIAAEPIQARAMQVEVRRADQQDDLAVFLFTDTLGIALAANLVNPFEEDSGETVFRAGLAYLLTVAVTDSNYYDFIRSRSDPITGRGFINRLQGGIGVFGSVETRTWILRVIADVDDPREGTYRLLGRAGGVDVDLQLEVYLDDLEPGGFSAFLDGTWVEGQLRRSADGRFGVDGRGEDEFVASFEVPVAGGELPRVYVLRGTRGTGGQPFDVGVIGGNTGTPETLVATLTARQLTGPAGLAVSGVRSRAARVVGTDRSH